MPSEPIHEMVLVSIVSASVTVSPPAWNIEYEVHNSGQPEVWLVVDESLTLRRKNNHIELSYARGKMQPGVQVFGYFDPKVVKLSPGESLRRFVNIAWPCHLSDIWNDERVSTPPFGIYKVTVRVGFALTAAPELEGSESVEGSVLRWQMEAVSPSFQMEIPQY
jgi:hypothetical protein